MPQPPSPTGFILWEGPSQFDRAPIAVLATMHSENEKTGNMVQTWILRQDVPSQEALGTGADRSVCSDCVHRPFLARLTGETPCYVNVGRAPLAVFNAYRMDRYPFDPDRAKRLMRRRAVRIGAYGDPAAAPSDLWLELLDGHTGGHTGYTQQWRTRPELASILMASVHTEADRREAAAAGWRTFRIVQGERDVGSREFVCPASSEAGHRMSCIECLACDGAGVNPRRASVVIVEHGAMLATARRIRRQLEIEA